MKHNDLMNGKYKKTCKYLNYGKHLLILSSMITGCVLISTFVHHILCMIFQQKCFSCCILQTDQLSLSDCLYIWR